MLFVRKNKTHANSDVHHNEMCHMVRGKNRAKYTLIPAHVAKYVRDNISPCGKCGGGN